MMKDGVNILDNATDGDGNVVGGAADGQATGVTFSKLCDLNEWYFTVNYFTSYFNH